MVGRLDQHVQRLQRSSILVFFFNNNITDPSPLSFTNWRTASRHGSPDGGRIVNPQRCCWSLPTPLCLPIALQTDHVQRQKGKHLLCMRRNESSCEDVGRPRNWIRSNCRPDSARRLGSNSPATIDTTRQQALPEGADGWELHRNRCCYRKVTVQSKMATVALSFCVEGQSNGKFKGRPMGLYFPWRWPLRWRAWLYWDCTQGWTPLMLS